MRARDRRTVADRARLHWLENGIPRQTMADLRDLSPRGMSCWVAQRIPAGTLVRIECPTQRLHGDAIVRHSSNKGARYLLGVEFSGSLEWRAPGEAPARRRWD